MHKIQATSLDKTGSSLYRKWPKLYDSFLFFATETHIPWNNSCSLKATPSIETKDTPPLTSIKLHYRPLNNTHN